MDFNLDCKFFVQMNCHLGGLLWIYCIVYTSFNNVRLSDGSKFVFQGTIF